MNIGLYVVGVLLRAVIPFFRALVEERAAADDEGRDPNEIRFKPYRLLGLVIAAVILIITSITVPGFVSNINTVTALVALGLGWFAADIGNEGQQWLNVLRKR